MSTSAQRRVGLPTIFNWNSPINRTQYLLQNILMLFVLFTCQLMVFVGTTRSGTAPSVQAFTGIMTPTVLLFGQAAVSRRLVDLEMSRWWMLAQIVPFLNLYLLCLLFAGRGKSARSKSPQSSEQAAANEGDEL
ncbi:DUF805 domain-containing protein [Rhodobacteraceae bacterium G21628-S1]|nr:DUF805 domain-containing protein [Rhodobacteraceae bacterium G21628-S1]